MRPHRHLRQANKDKAAQKAALVAQNVANPDPKPVLGVRADGRSQSLGYRASPSVKGMLSSSHQFRIHMVPMGSGTGADSILTAKQKATKYAEKGPYKGSTKMPSNSTEVKVRVGTIPPRTVMLTDEHGDKRPVKIRAQPKWGPIGSQPKDGGKY